MNSTHSPSTSPRKRLRSEYEDKKEFEQQDSSADVAAADGYSAFLSRQLLS